MLLRLSGCCHRQLAKCSHVGASLQPIMFGALILGACRYFCGLGMKGAGTECRIGGRTTGTSVCGHVRGPTTVLPARFGVCAGTGEFVAALLKRPVYGAWTSEPEGYR